MKMNWISFISSMKGRVPIDCRTWDKLIWDSTKGSGVYIVRKRYQTLRAIHPYMPGWNHIWYREAILKIIFFFWLTKQNQKLALDNLRRRCVVGPNWCALRSKMKSTKGISLYTVVILKKSRSISLATLCFKSLLLLPFRKPLIIPSSIENVRKESQQPSAIKHLLPRYLFGEIWKARNS